MPIPVEILEKIKNSSHHAVTRTLKIHDFLKNNEGQAFKIREITVAINTNKTDSSLIPDHVTHNTMQLVRESIYRMLKDDKFRCIRREKIGNIQYIYHDGSNCTL